MLKDGKCVLPPVTFSAFIMSLNTAALYNLGELENPATKQRDRDLTLAKQTVDTLILLQEKTAGNLTGEEKGLLNDIIFDLKMRYVKAKQ